MQAVNLRKILITGAGGYIGTKLVSKLLHNGFEIIALDTFWFGCYLENHKNLVIVKADLRSVDLPKLFVGIDAVVHLASISNDPSYELNPVFSESINVTASIRLIEHCRKSNIKRFIFASSSSVYGVRKEHDVTEKLMPEPITIYSKSKITIENYLKTHGSKDFDIVILRPATVYGVSPRLRLDVVCNLLSAQAYYDKLITVHGGEQLRPQIHIDKMTDVYLACLNEIKYFSGEIFNVSEENYSVKQIAEQIKSLSDHIVDINFLPVFDTRSYKINSNKFLNYFKLNLFSNLENGITELIHYFKKNPNIVWTDEIYHNVKKLKNIQTEKNELSRDFLCGSKFLK